MTDQLLKQILAIWHEGARREFERTGAWPPIPSGLRDAAIHFDVPQLTAVDSGLCALTPGRGLLLPAICDGGPMLWICPEENR